jgi:hypothetical protein
LGGGCCTGYCHVKVFLQTYTLKVQGVAQLAMKDVKILNTYCSYASEHMIYGKRYVFGMSSGVYTSRSVWINRDCGNNKQIKNHLVF